MYLSTSLNDKHGTSSPAPFGVECVSLPTSSLTFNQSQILHGSQHFEPYRREMSKFDKRLHDPSAQHGLGQRVASPASLYSPQSQSSHESCDLEIYEASVQREPCLVPDCGGVFKDLKAHMLSHQNERPEKCPIVTCEYNSKGFARKYDMRRHTINHYKGIMVCGFCPSLQPTTQDGFTRVDSFKGHLNHVHGAEHRLPDSREKCAMQSRNSHMSAESNVGTCSTCGHAFRDVQVFYEHMDDCIFRAVLNIDPCEEINQKNLEVVLDDVRVQETLARHRLPPSVYFGYLGGSKNARVNSNSQGQMDRDNANDGLEASANTATKKIKTLCREDPADEQFWCPRTIPSQHVRREVTNSTAKGDAWLSGAKQNPAQLDLRRGLTFSKGGVPHAGCVAYRKKRTTFPSSWKHSATERDMKKRVLCVYDGERRLWKDDIMLYTDGEAKSRGDFQDDLARRSFVPELDVQTLLRAEALHQATEEEKGEWIPDNVVSFSRKRAQYT
jgi:hypothetical protein